MHGAPVAVGEDLQLDVARPAQIFLDDHPLVAEGVQRLALRRRQRFGQLVGPLDDPHALAAAAGGGLEQHREADGLGFGGDPRLALVVAVIARHHRHAGAPHQLLGDVLAAHRLDGGGWGAHPDQPGLAYRPRKRRPLRQEAIARMHRRGPGACRRLQDRLDAQIALPRRSRPDPHRFVGEADMPRVAVGVRIHRHRPHAEPAACGDDAAGDLAAIGNQQGVQHRRPIPCVTSLP